MAEQMIKLGLQEVADIVKGAAKGMQQAADAIGNSQQFTIREVTLMDLYDMVGFIPSQIERLDLRNQIKDILAGA